MNLRKFNWPVWAGFLLSIIASASYPFVFVWYTVTRDFPWGSLALFALAGVLLFFGIRRAFAKELPHPLRSKIAGGIAVFLSVAVFCLFIFIAFIGARQMPASTGAPHVGQKAPDFTLSDVNGKQVSLTELVSAPINGKAPKGALLVFYRGHW